MATIYYNAAADTDWNTLGNWWTDAACTAAAASLPTSGDSVILLANVEANAGGSAPTVVDLTTRYFFGIDITVTGTAYFNGVNAHFSYHTLTGNAAFDRENEAGDYYGNTGAITGNATFTNNSLNNGAVQGNATFTNGSTNANMVSGDATFNDSSPNTGTVNGTATFTKGAWTALPVFGTASSLVFSSATRVTFTLIGTYNSDNGLGWNNTLPSATFTAGAPLWTISDGGISYGAITGDVIFNNSVLGGGASSVTGNVTFNGGGLGQQGYITGNAVFNNAYALGTTWGGPAGISGTATFNGNTVVARTDVGGLATFDEQAANTTMSYGGPFGFFGGVVITVKRGVNGSSILGVV